MSLLNSILSIKEFTKIPSKIENENYDKYGFFDLNKNILFFKNKRSKKKNLSEIYIEDLIFGLFSSNYGDLLCSFHNILLRHEYTNKIDENLNFDKLFSEILKILLITKHSLSISYEIIKYDGFIETIFNKSIEKFNNFSSDCNIENILLTFRIIKNLCKISSNNTIQILSKKKLKILNFITKELSVIGLSLFQKDIDYEYLFTFQIPLIIECNRLIKILNSFDDVKLFTNNLNLIEKNFQIFLTLIQFCFKYKKINDKINLKNEKLTIDLSISCFQIFEYYVSTIEEKNKQNFEIISILDKFREFVDSDCIILLRSCKLNIIENKINNENWKNLFSTILFFMSSFYDRIFLTKYHKEKTTESIKKIENLMLKKYSEEKEFSEISEMLIFFLNDSIENLENNNEKEMFFIYISSIINFCLTIVNNNSNFKNFFKKIFQKIPSFLKRLSNQIKIFIESKGKFLKKNNKKNNEIRIIVLMCFTILNENIQSIFVDKEQKIEEVRSFYKYFSLLCCHLSVYPFDLKIIKHCMSLLFENYKILNEFYI
jgi:hypothetical protein